MYVRQAVILLCSAPVRPQLESRVQFGTPHFKKDVHILERVWRRAIKIKGLANITHEETLKDLSTFNLEKNRLRGDLITVICYKEDNDQLISLFTDGRTKCNQVRLQQGRF